jgi:hypothetical protein
MIVRNMIFLRVGRKSGLQAAPRYEPIIDFDIEIVPADGISAAN